jgi:hypothetical protein
LVEYNNHLWDIPEGQEYLTALFEYATALHNLTNKSRDAITIFEEMLDLDREDHMVKGCFRLFLFLMLASVESKRADSSLLFRSS